jgi:acyl carrier protein
MSGDADLLARTRDLMGKVFKVDPKTLPDTASVSSVAAWDSLNHTELLFALEDAFDISWSGEEAERLDNLPEIVDSIAAKLSAKQAAG